MASKSNSSDKKIIITACILVAVLIATGVTLNILGKVPDNDPNLVGNTAGNLNNSGLFCESDSTIYFANAYDGGSLYSMNADQSKVKKLYDGNCRYINAGGDYLYFSMCSSDGGTGLGYVLKNSGIYRAKTSGHRIKAISDDASVIMALSGNTLFYQGQTGAGIGLKALDVTKKSPKPDVIEGNFVINPACIESGYIYFNGTQKDHYLYSMNTATNDISPLWGGNVWNPVYDGGYFYYMDISNDYCLCRYSPSAQTVDILTHDRVDMFNVGYGCVFYSTSTSDVPGLYRMNADGSDNHLIMEGVYTDINITSTYTYFHEFNLDTPMYYVPTYGGSQPSVFSAAELAANK